MNCTLQCQDYSLGQMLNASESGLHTRIPEGHPHHAKHSLTPNENIECAVQYPSETFFLTEMCFIL